MDGDVIAAFATLLTPLTALTGAIITFLLRRIKKLENENANLVGYVLRTCTDKAERIEGLADIIVGSRGKEGDV